MATVTLTSAVAGQVATAVFYNNNNNALLNQINGNLDATNLANLAVTTAKINTGAVTGIKIAMGSDAQGDILFRGASNYQRLGAGTSGDVLITGGAGANPAWGDSNKNGNVIQCVNYQTGELASGTTAIPSDDSIPQITEGDEYMTLAITPISATSKLKIDVVLNYTTGSEDCTCALFQDATAGALAAVSCFVSSGSPNQCNFTHYMTAGGISATTFRVRAGATSTGIRFNGVSGPARRLGGVMSSSITITEIKA